MPLRAIFVGVPESNKILNVSDEKTPRQILDEQKIATNAGVVQLSQRTLSNADLDRPLASLGVVDNDSLFVIKKLSNAA